MSQKTLEVESNVKCKNTNMSRKNLEGNVKMFTEKWGQVQCKNVKKIQICPKRLRRPSPMLKCKQYKYVPKLRRPFPMLKYEKYKYVPKKNIGG